MVRLYLGDNPWRKGTRLTVEDSESMFARMATGMSIREISDSMNIHILTARDNYEHLLENVFSSSFSEFIHGYTDFYFQRLRHVRMEYAYELEFWSKFPFSTHDELFKCTFRCDHSTKSADIKFGHHNIVHNIRAIHGKLRCKDCPVRNSSLSHDNRRPIGLSDHVLFLKYLKRLRGVRKGESFSRHVNLFKTIQSYMTAMAFFRYSDIEIRKRVPPRYFNFEKMQIDDEERDNVHRYCLSELGLAPGADKPDDVALMRVMMDCALSVISRRNGTIYRNQSGFSLHGDKYIDGYEMATFVGHAYPFWESSPIITRKRGSSNPSFVARIERERLELIGSRVPKFFRILNRRPASLRPFKKNLDII